MRGQAYHDAVAIRRYWARYIAQRKGPVTLTEEQCEEALANRIQAGSPDPPIAPPRHVTQRDVSRVPRDVAPSIASRGLHAAICCPGPSLKETWHGQNDEHDFVIAVNRAMNHVDADWWCAHDPTPAFQCEGAPRVGACLGPGVLRDFRDGRRKPLHADFNSLVLLDAREMRDRQGHRAPPYGWTVCDAMVLAGWLGADRITFYGDDKRGGVYHDGTENPGLLKSDESMDRRWTRERSNCEAVGTWLKERGVKWIRHVSGTIPQSDN